jgi:hypothetical protein
MITVQGSHDTEEYQAAQHLRQLMVAAWPPVAERESHDVTIIAGAKCYGQHDLFEPLYLFKRRTAMAENPPTDPIVQVSYSETEDTLTFVFQPHPRPGVAEEAGDEIWVRYDPETHEVITMDVLHFSSRVHDAFGPSLTYTERTDLKTYSGDPQ